MITRRTLLKTGGLAAIGSLTIGTSGCGKDLTTYTSIIISALEELSPLLPGQSSFISNAIKIARDFDEAYRAGKFANATTLFSNLAGVIGQIADSVGVTSPAVKTTIAIAGVAMRAIAVLLQFIPLIAQPVDGVVHPINCHLRSVQPVHHPAQCVHGA